MISLLLSFLIPLLFLFGISLTNSIIFKKRFEYSLPVAIMECLIITYLSGFLNLQIGFFICIFLSLSSIPLIIWTYKKKTYSIKLLFLTDIFWVFICIYVFVFIINMGKYFSHWDEYSHWGVMVKELLRLNKFYYVKESVLVYHKDYPPLASILEYIWCKLCVSFKERHLYNGKIIFSLSLFLPIIGTIMQYKKPFNKCWKHIAYIFITSLFIINLGILKNVGEASFYRTIYVETILTSIFVYGIFILIEKEQDKIFYFLNLMLMLSCLLLTKQIAIYFYAILFIIYIAHNIVLSGRKILLNRGFCLSTVLSFGIPLILWKIWKTAVTLFAPTGQFDSSKFSIQNIIQFAKGAAENYQYDTLKRYISSLFRTPVIEKPFSISYIVIIVLFSVIILTIYKLEKDSTSRNQILTLGIGIILGAIGYIFVMLISYLYGFSVEESLSLACYSRYMSTMVYPILLIIVLLVLKITIKYQYLNVIPTVGILTISLFLIIIPISSIKEELLPGICYDKYGTVFDGDCNILKANTPENSRIFVVCQGDNGSARNVIAYKTNPREISSSYYSLGKPYDVDDIYTKDITIDKFIQILKDYNYIYLSNIDEQFINKYKSLFYPIVDLNNQQLYKISFSSDSSIDLKRIEY